MNVVTIYDHPLDYPEHFVARVFTMDGPTGTAFFSQDVEEVRRWARHVAGELNQWEPIVFPRDPQDDKFIVESWM